MPRTLAQSGSITRSYAIRSEGRGVRRRSLRLSGKRRLRFFALRIQMPSEDRLVVPQALAKFGTQGIFRPDEQIRIKSPLHAILPGSCRSASGQNPISRSRAALDPVECDFKLNRAPPRPSCLCNNFLIHLKLDRALGSRCDEIRLEQRS